MAALLPLEEGKGLAVSPEGHYRPTPPQALERELVYIVELPDGRQETLTPAAFAKRFGWKNDPERVRLAPQPSEVQPPPVKQDLLPPLKADTRLVPWPWSAAGPRWPAFAAGPSRPLATAAVSSIWPTTPTAHTWPSLVGDSRRRCLDHANGGLAESDLPSACPPNVVEVADWDPKRESENGGAHPDTPARAASSSTRTSSWKALWSV